MLAQDEPPLIGYDQDLWIDWLHADETDLDRLLDLFDALRLANVTLWNARAASGGSGWVSTPNAVRRATTWRSG